MKLLFFSDIHGVPENLERFFSYLEAFAPDRLILLGDALYHGPRNGVPPNYDPTRVADLLNRHKNEILAVRGNCDSEVDQMLLEFPIMADYSEILTESGRFFITHGHRWNESNLPPIPPDTILVHGHTHIPEIKRLENGLTVFNPGSVSLPKKAFPRSFGFFDGKELSVHCLDDGKRILP